MTTKKNYELGYPVSALAVMTGRSRAWFYDQINLGHIPAVEIGGAKIVPSWWVSQTFGKKEAA